MYTVTIFLIYFTNPSHWRCVIVWLKKGFFLRDLREREEKEEHQKSYYELLPADEQKEWENSNIQRRLKTFKQFFLNKTYWQVRCISRLILNNHLFLLALDILHAAIHLSNRLLLSKRVTCESAEIHFSLSLTHQPS